MIKTWAADITALYEEEIYWKYYREMPLHRREKADGILKKENRVQSIGVWTLYEIARRETGINESAAFNLSHSGQFVLCSIEDSQDKDVKVGCDIEKIGKAHMKLAGRYFLKAEKEYIFGQATEKERAEAFYSYWVLKESFMKATRFGMKLGLDTFEIRCREEGQPELVKQPGMIKEKYFFREYQWDKPYKIAVCSTKNDFAEELAEIDLSTYWSKI